MIGGVNFQPGGGPNGNPEQPRNGNAGVQEAIKILSLRLPKVVGAQAAAPMALLTSQGGGGNRVDSVVNQILARIMPTGQPMGQPMAGFAPQPQAPDGAPSFSGSAQPNYAQSSGPPALPQWPWTNLGSALGGGVAAPPVNTIKTPRFVMTGPDPSEVTTP